MRIENDVLAVLSNAEVNANALKLVGQLDRNLYVRTDKVLQAAGGKWNRKEKAHVFDSDASERIDQIILSGSVDIPKDEFNFFASTEPVVGRVMELADVRPGMLLLEPEAGLGALAFACVEAGAKVVCYELMKQNCEVLASDARLHSATQADFLGVDPEPIYDRVVMNPPFMKQADIKHVMHAFKFLKSGGKLTAVMSAGALFRENRLTKEFRDLVSSSGGAFESLPEGAFKESGTMVNTVIATMFKPA